jgi:hypothetical protein
MQVDIVATPDADTGIVVSSPILSPLHLVVILLSQEEGDIIAFLLSPPRASYFIHENQLSLINGGEIRHPE